MDFILVLTGMLSWIPKVALDFGHDGTHGCEERCQSHLITVPRVYRLASFGEDKKVLTDLIKFLKTVLNLNIDALWVDVVPFEE